MMSSQISSLTSDKQDISPNCTQRSPLLGPIPQGDNSQTALKTIYPDDGFSPPTEGPSCGSIRLGSEQSPASSRAYTPYCEIPSLSIDSPNFPNGHPNRIKNSYQNDVKPAKPKSVPAKTKPPLRPPPRSASEGNVHVGFPIPPRTYLNNRVCSPSATNYKNTIVPDCNNEIRGTSTGTDSPKGPQVSYNRQRLCVIVAFVAIFMALSLAAAAATFSIHNFLTRRDSKQVQDAGGHNIFGILQNETKASAHLGLMVKDPVEEEISGKANYTMYITDDETRKYHDHVRLWDRGVTILIEGMYFVYSSIGFNINQNATNCDTLPHKTWVHHVMLTKGDELTGTALLKSEHTCCTGCPEYHSSGFTGGVFHLKPNDKISVRVSAPVLVFDDRESSFLGLFLMK